MTSLYMCTLRAFQFAQVSAHRPTARDSLPLSFDRLYKYSDSNKFTLHQILIYSIISFQCFQRITISVVYIIGVFENKMSCIDFPFIKVNAASLILFYSMFLCRSVKFVVPLN